MSQNDVVFDRLLHSIGDNGKFQTRYNIIFNFLLSVCAAMIYMNLILVLSIPDHWCHVAGRENTTFTLEEWKDKHIPKELDVQGKISHSSCKMYNLSIIQSGVQPDKHDIVGCQYGYDYDHTWYISTVPSSQDWVCDKEMYVTNILAASRFGEVIGGFVLGQLGDYIGRRPICLIAMVLGITGKVMSVFTAHFYYAFMVACVIASLPSLAILQGALVISMEITNPERRAALAQIQNIGWSLAMVLISLICWAIPDWSIYLMITSAPIIVFVFAYRYLIESPRWLASRGKITKCISELSNIAKKNGTTLEPEWIIQLEEKSKKPEQIYGVMSCFSSWRLSKNTFVIVLTWIICFLCYFVIVLNTTNLGGNPFLNFLWQSVIELPAYVVGKICCDRIGRRFTGILSFLGTLLMFIPVIFTVRDNDLVIATNSLMVVAKFFVSLAFYILTLETMEIYPTCLRQTGMSLGVVVSSAFGTFGPYIVYLGTAFDARFPYVIMGVLSLIGAVAQLFLPETLYAKLPETLHEAKLFGKDQPFFSLPRKPKVTWSPEESKLFNS